MKPAQTSASRVLNKNKDFTRVEHGPRQLNMTEVTWTLGHTLSASLALEIPIYGT